LKEKRHYSSEADPTKDRIRQAALECIGRTSIRELSVRAIAAEAGVNVATVHYYFGTKDALICAALQEFYSQVAASFERVLASELPAREKLVEFLMSYSSLFHAHPGLFASVIDSIFKARMNADSPSDGTLSGSEQILFSMVTQLKPRALGLVRELTGITDETELAFRMFRTMTSVLHPILLSEFSRSLFGLDLGEAEMRRRYIGSVIDSL
jgi:TetR/AcrR family transcriptional regulator, regulator of cefoperazone and chloramphenicol sensitivity